MPGQLILVRGGGDLASGVILRLHRSGFKVAVCELPQPQAVRLGVSFSEAVYNNVHSVEGVPARLCTADGLKAVLEAGEIPVLVDPEAKILSDPSHSWLAVVDARMMKMPPAPLPARVPLHIGLGPGFHAGENCDAVVETRRSHTLGRVFWEGRPQADSGLPEGDPRRVLRASAAGIIRPHAHIGEHVEAGQVLASILMQDGQEKVVTSPLSGALRGLLHEGVSVARDTKIGDVDPRDDVRACWLVSDKALSVAGGVLEAILAFQNRH